MARRLTPALAGALGRALPVLAALTALLLVWEIAALVFAIPAYVLPRPGGILSTMVAKADLLSAAVGVTALEAVAGFLLGALIGIALALLMVLIPPLETLLVPLVIAFNSVPSVAFVPLVLLWFGLGMASKIALAAFAVAVAVLLNTLQGLKRPEADAINLLRSFGASRVGILLRLRWPAALPLTVTGLRVGLARSTIAVIVAEMMGAYAGIGQVIYQATAMMDSLTVWAGVLVASLTSLVLYGLLVALDRKLVWWR
ncbi:ABC transporter permease [Aureimonas endophytica]|uniref:ABC transporter permease n=1 Tax=Aureimonas endophytica TaxID=2027858 RepID=A0A916ZN17_9HYPH|nr:ABC transporter permease [Aureimonas endophytica]GGE03719.1 ABC transporter permease [Aureimonas endophytica]